MSPSSDGGRGMYSWIGREGGRERGREGKREGGKGERREGRRERGGRIDAALSLHHIND